MEFNRLTSPSASPKVHRLRSKLVRQFSLPVVKTEVLAGMTVALALIPESLAFAAIAGVNPMVALYTSFCMAIVVGLMGGRVAMISAATGSMALLMTSLVKQHGVEYLFAATILTGILQVAIGLLRFDRFFSFIPQSVIAGFVNALGLLIFVAQIQQLVGQSWQAYVMVGLTLAIVYLLPRFTKAIPSPLVAIVTMTVAAIALQLPIRRVGDIGEITRALPTLHWPQVSFSLDTLLIILPYAVTLAIVGLLESLLTAALLDEMTESRSSKNREVRGQGIANIVTGMLGGMAGCGMVGQSIINIRSGATKRLSTCVSGAFLLFSIFVLRDVVQQIPMAVLIGVMIMVASETFDWRSLKTLRQMPWDEAIVMPITVAITLTTHNLAYGVLAGVVISALRYAWRSTQISIITSVNQQGAKVYHLSGQLFFGSVSPLLERFDPRHDPVQVVIDLHHASICDHTAAQTVMKLIGQYQQRDKQVTLTGLDAASYRILETMGMPNQKIHLRKSGHQVA